jgi:excisionase family DNA binding protein
VKNSMHLGSDHIQSDTHLANRPQRIEDGLPRRLLTAFEVAELVGCHEESVRRAYLSGQLQRQRFGVRSWRFHPTDVEDWIRRGAPTRIS